MIRSFDGHEPDIHESAYVDPSAVVIGEVEIGKDASVWPNVTIRGDHGKITLEEGVNIQDNAVLHEGGHLEPYATVGHGAIVHNCRVGERALVGMNAVVLDRATVGEEAMVAANSLVPEGMAVPDSTLVAGTPAEEKRTFEESPWREAGEVYVDLARRHRDTSERLD
ncbi:gamma carbonic anhydrase family protein [Natronomonas sp. EA1]|uniref:gamma carbonic anhydrase family protein n=1 Tax=Natronomonas sp. EA1 TaxID=3421655 RepID=UPI003EB9CA4B